MDKKTKLIVLGLIIPIIGIGAVYGLYQIGVITGSVSVTEPISYSPSTFSVAMFPGETKTQTITITNSATIPIVVSPTITVNPSSGLTVTPSSTSITVPSSGSATLTLTMVATSTGTYSVSVTLSR